MLKPVGPLPEAKNEHVTDRVAPPDHAEVTSIASVLTVLLAEAAPGLYRPDDLARSLAHLPHLTPDRLTAALRYLGHDLVEDLDATTSTPLVRVVGPDAVAGRDRQVLHRARERCPNEVTVRNLQRVCHWRGTSAWGVRGSCDRLQAAGHLVAHPLLRRWPVTVWQAVPVEGVWWPSSVSAPVTT